MRGLRSVLSDDHGINMAELVTAVLLLGIIIAGSLPFAVNSIVIAQQNAVTGQANRIVATLLDDAKQQLQSGSCAAGTTSPALSTSDTERFQAQRTVGCEARLATIIIEVQALSDPSTTIASATTKVVTAS